MELRELLTKYGFDGDKVPIIKGSALDALNHPEDPEKIKPILDLMAAVDEYIHSDRNISFSGNINSRIFKLLLF